MLSKLSQHISYLRDFFKCYKDFEDKHLDTLEILITKLYWEFGILSILSTALFSRNSGTFNTLNEIALYYSVND